MWLFFITHWHCTVDRAFIKLSAPRSSERQGDWESIMVANSRHIGGIAIIWRMAHFYFWVNSSLKTGRELRRRHMGMGKCPMTFRYENRQKSFEGQKCEGFSWADMDLCLIRREWHADSFKQKWKAGVQGGFVCMFLCTFRLSVLLLVLPPSGLLCCLSPLKHNASKQRTPPTQSATRHTWNKHLKTIWVIYYLQST